MNLRKSILLLVAGMLAIGLVAPSFAQQGTAPAPASKPEKAAKSTETKTTTTAKPAEAKKSTTAPKVDLNAATKEELMKLPGVTDAIAEKITQGRPYASKEDLEKKNIVTKDEYSKLSSHVTVKAEPKKK
jgi:DNA uptake protein ComE-like DNA-binding protein